MEWNGLEWNGMGCDGLDWTLLDRQHLTGLDWIGWGWIGLDWIGLDSGLVDALKFSCSALKLCENKKYIYKYTPRNNKISRNIN